MSFQAMTWAVKQKVGSATGKAILLMLANYADDEGKCFPGQDKLAAECKCSPRTVREWLDKFEKMGIVSRSERRRGDGYRTSDLIILDLESSPAGNSPENTSPENDDNLTGSSFQSHRQETPSNLLVEPSDNHQQPRAGAGKPETDLDNLQAKLVEAAGDKIQPHSVFDLSSIIGLLGAGVDLETDILPTIRARSAKMRSPARGWGYFTDAIRDACSRRVEAGQGLAKPVRAITPDAELQPDALEAERQKRLKYARKIDLGFKLGPDARRRGVPSFQSDRPTNRRAELACPRVGSMKPETILISEHVATIGVRRFERGVSSDSDNVKAYLAEFGIELQRLRGRYWLRQGSGKLRVTDWNGVIRRVDELRIAQGLQPFVKRAA
ncbi:helix-turn-helix domain-containing protein [Paraburkholderia aspalathi]|nr:helix-turn-helix domain-containing protein [Paraburkholderia aspalathi]